MEAWPTVAMANTMMSIMLVTCVARPLMDMTVLYGALVVPRPAGADSTDNGDDRAESVRILPRPAEFPA
jgi:hypothetical protein